MSQRIYHAFLNRQFEEGVAIDRDSDLLRLQALAGQPPTRYAAEFRCAGLVREAGAIVEAHRFIVVYSFPPDYLRRPRDSWEIVAWIGPQNIWHPNISRAICIGPIVAGTPFVELLYRTFEVISYQKFCANEFDSLNADACAWTRNNLTRLPVDGRPLKWRAPDIEAVQDA